MAADRVLVLGDDASEDAEEASRWIGAQRWPGWRLEVVTAQLPPVGPPISPERSTPHPWEPGHRRVFDERCAFTSVGYLLAEDDPRLVLSERSDADLVVVGPRGSGRLKALSIGSTTDYLTHHSPVPLVVAHASNEVRRVLLCVDSSDGARRLTDVLTRLPWLGGAAVHVLHVIDDRPEDDTAAEEAAQLLEGKAAKVTVSHRHGAATAAILDEIVDTGADLVVVGTRGRNRRRMRWLGSTARALTHISPIAVLLVPEAPGQ